MWPQGNDPVWCGLPHFSHTLVVGGDDDDQIFFRNHEDKLPAGTATGINAVGGAIYFNVFTPPEITIGRKGAGMQAHFPDALYENAGADVVETSAEIWKRSDLIIKIRAPEMHTELKQHEASLLRSESCLIAMLDPARNTALVKQLAETGATTLSTDAIPRISRAQSMDVLSSLANISGYMPPFLHHKQ